MKKSIVFIILCFLSVSCNKEENEIMDYRDSFIGSYGCHKTGYIYDEVSTNVDTFEIIIVSKYSDSLIKILDATIFIDQNGEFGGGLYPDPNYHLFDGCFKNDSVFLNLQIGGLGCYSRFNYIGKKF